MTRASLIVLALLSVVNAQTYPDLIGVGISTGAEGARSRMFVDLGRVFRPFQNSDGSQTPADGNGWPTADGSTVIFDIRPVPAWNPPIDDPQAFQPDWSGVYALSFHGQADVSPQGSGDFTLQNLAWDPDSNLTTADLTVGPGSGLLVLDFRNTRRTPASDLGSGVTDLHLIRPGYSGDTSKIFTDEFLAALAPFRVLRFMGFSETNDNNPLYGDPDNITHWANRHVPTDATQQAYGRKRGFAWEYAIQICNLACKDMWLNIPVAADDDYVRNLAELLKDQLNPSLRIYIEYSNEVWNPGFQQYRYNQAAAETEVATGGSPLAADGYPDRTEWGRRRAAKRLVEAAGIFADVFGPDSINTRVRAVYSWWTIYPAQYQNVLQWVKNTYGDPSKVLWAVAKTNYYNAQRASATATPDEILGAMSCDSDNGRRYTTQLKQVADQFGLSMVTYEAGPDNGGGSTINVGNRILANRRPGILDLMLHDARDNWFGLGGGLYMYLELSGAYSRYGCWGQNEDIVDLATYKYHAILQLTGSVPPLCYRPISNKRLT